MIRSVRKTHKQFVKEMQAKFGDVYNFIEEYTLSTTKILVQHKCEDRDWYTWSCSLSNLLHGKMSCPKCSGKSTGTDEFKRKVFKLVGDEYIVTGDYHTSVDYIMMKHNTKDCQHESLISACGFLYHNTRYPVCTPTSRGEYSVETNLIDNLINFEKQYKFKDCVYKNALRFDFAVFEDLEKTKLKYLIEYQGEQHYMPRTFNGMSKAKAKINFTGQKIKDKIKVDYCIENDIKLLIIPYWEFDNIDKIIINN